MNQHITVSMVDDEADLREHIAGFVGAAPGFRCVSTYASAAEALRHLPEDKPDVVLMDINLGDLSGIECVRLLKPLAPAKLLAAIREVHEGGSPMSAPIARKLVQSLQSVPARGDANADLSPREREVLHGLAEGQAYKQIADTLGVSIHTVRPPPHHLEHVRYLAAAGICAHPGGFAGAQVPTLPRRGCGDLPQRRFGGQRQPLRDGLFRPAHPAGGGGDAQTRSQSAGRALSPDRRGSVHRRRFGPAATGHHAPGSEVKRPRHRLL